MRRFLPTLSVCALIVTAFLVAACSPDPSVGPRATGGSQPDITPGAITTDPPAEANVISGRVTTEPGVPLAGARMRIVGYTGGANLGQEIETVETNADGVYRYEVPRGLYEVLGTATIAFDGQLYMFDLEPVDGRCDQQMSDAGIVKDFVLQLTGLKSCRRDPLPDNFLSYNGAAIQLIDSLSSGQTSDTVIEYTLEPLGPLADGSTGQTLTMSRTVGGLHTSAGPIDEAWILYDIPLANYRITAAIVESDGGRTALFGSTLLEPAPSAAVDVAFGARIVVGELAVGYYSIIPQVQVHDAGAGG